MQLPDEAITYRYQSLLIPTGEEWSALAELRTQQYISPARLKGMASQLMQVKSQIATERELQAVPPELQPMDACFIDLPQRTLDNYRRRGEASELGRIIALGNRLREQVDRVIILGVGGSYLGARALFDALCHSYHNELPPKSRLGI